MIKIAIIILALLIGCAKPPKPEPRFVGQYLSLDGETFKTDYPNLKELGKKLSRQLCQIPHVRHVRQQNLNGPL